MISSNIQFSFHARASQTNSRFLSILGAETILEEITASYGFMFKVVLDSGDKGIQSESSET